MMINNQSSKKLRMLYQHKILNKNPLFRGQFWTYLGFIFENAIICLNANVTVSKWRVSNCRGEQVMSEQL